MGMIEMLEWRQPLWLLAGFLPAILTLLTYLLRHRQTSYCEPGLLPWVSAQHTTASTAVDIRLTLRILAWILLCIALAGPRIAVNSFYPQKSLPEVSFIVDVSQSMAANDLTPDRLGVAKFHMSNFIQRHPYRYSIILFTARAHILMPMTDDREALLSAIETIQTGMLPTAGTRITSGIRTAIEARRTDQPGTFIIISDGGDAGDTATHVDELDSLIKSSNITIHGWGIGTTEGELIPDKESRWITLNNQPVVSRLNTSWLMHLSRLTGGSYRSVSHKTDSLNNFALSGVFSSTEKETGALIVWREHFYFFLLTGAIVLLASLIKTLPTPARRIQHISLSIASASLLFVAYDVWATTQSSQAWQEYNKKDYATAAQVYSRIDSYDGKMGLASSLYQLQDYSQALTVFAQAVLYASTDDERANAIFNMANCKHRLNDYAQAIALYNDVLRYRPNDAASITNLPVSAALHDMQRRSQAARVIANDTEGSAGRNRIVDETTINVNDTRVSSGKGESSKNTDYAGVKDNTRIVTQHNIQSSRLASDASTRIDMTNWQYAVSDKEKLLLAMTNQPASDALLWKRIFEIEENFPAPLDSPRRITGINPW